MELVALDYPDLLLLVTGEVSPQMLEHLLQRLQGRKVPYSTAMLEVGYFVELELLELRELLELDSGRIRLELLLVLASLLQAEEHGAARLGIVALGGIIVALEAADPLPDLAAPIPVLEGCPKGRQTFGPRTEPRS